MILYSGYFCTNSRTTCEPMKPAPPVIRIVIVGFFSGCESKRRGRRVNLGTVTMTIYAVSITDTYPASQSTYIYTVPPYHNNCTQTSPCCHAVISCQG